METTDDNPPEKSLPNWVIIVAVVALIAGMFATVSTKKPVTDYEGKPAPFFQLVQRHGGIGGYTQPGRVQVIDFWATWCPPCVKQTPAIERIRQTRPDVDVISINTDDPSANRERAIQAFMKKGPWDFPMLLDDGSASGLYKITNLPTLVIVGADGNVVYANSGVKSLSAIEDLIDTASAQ